MKYMGNALTTVENVGGMIKWSPHATSPQVITKCQTWNMMIPNTIEIGNDTQDVNRNSKLIHAWTSHFPMSVIGGGKQNDL